VHGNEHLADGHARGYTACFCMKCYCLDETLGSDLETSNSHVPLLNIAHYVFPTCCRHFRHRRTVGFLLRMTPWWLILRYKKKSLEAGKNLYLSNG